ncbi:hypothetical protein PR048_016847, partial [Dryococelus australis]
MSLYDDMDAIGKQKPEQVVAWSSGIKLLQSQLQLKKAGQTQAVSGYSTLGGDTPNAVTSSGHWPIVELLQMHHFRRCPPPHSSFVTLFSGKLTGRLPRQWRGFVLCRHFNILWLCSKVYCRVHTADSHGPGKSGKVKENERGQGNQFWNPDQIFFMLTAELARSPFNLGDMGCQAVTSHAKGKMQNTDTRVGSKITDISEECTKIAGSSTLGISTVSVPGCSVSVESFCLKDDVVRAEVLWSLKVVRHASAENLLHSFTFGIQPMSLNKILSVSMDGPNVNLSFIKKLYEKMREGSGSDGEILVNTGVCGLHVVHDLKNLIENLMQRFVKSSKLPATVKKLLAIDSHCRENLLELKNIDIAFQNKKLLREVVSTDSEVLEFKKDIEYQDLWEVVKMCLIFSHGNATVEIGFSVNKSLLVENLHEESLVAQRKVYDDIKYYETIHNVPITQKMLPCPKRDSLRKSGTTLPPVIDLKSKKEEEDSNSNSSTGFGSFPTGKENRATNQLPKDAEWNVEDEYDPMFPNDYEKVVKDLREIREREKEQEEEERRRKNREERERRARDRYENEERRANNPTAKTGFAGRKGSDEDEDDKLDDKPQLGRLSGAAIAPPASLQDSPAELRTTPMSYGASVAAKIMAKYGFKEGQGLGKKEQGISSALQVEKTSKRGGSTSQNAEQKPEPTITEIMKSPSKVVLLRSSFSAGALEHCRCTVSGAWLVGSAQSQWLVLPSNEVAGTLPLTGGPGRLLLELGQLWMAVAAGLQTAGWLAVGNLLASQEDSHNWMWAPSNPHRGCKQGRGESWDMRSLQLTGGLILFLGVQTAECSRCWVTTLPFLLAVEPLLWEYGIQEGTMTSLNMVGPGEVDEDLEPEVKDECNTKYGDVIKVLIFEQPNVPAEEAVRIFVEFKRIESAIK